MRSRVRNQVLIVIALGIVVGLGARCYVTRDAADHVRDPAPDRDERWIRAEPRAASAIESRAPSTTRTAGTHGRETEGFEAPWRPSNVPLSAMDAAEPRDEAWAAEMERAIAAFARTNLESLFPGGHWGSVTCRSTFCEMTYAVPAAEDLAAKRATLLLVGVGVQVQRESEPPVEGVVTQRIRYRMTDAATGARTSGPEFAESQRSFAERFPERVAAIRDGVELDRAGGP